MARLPELEAFAEKHGLHLISIADLIRYRRHKDKLVRRIAGRPASRPTSATSPCYVYESVLDGEHHLALVQGRRGRGKSDVLSGCTRECLTGDVFGSLRCDCGPQLPRGHAAHRRATAAASSSTCAATRAGASAWPTSSGPTTSRRRATTPSTPTSSSGLPVDSREYGIGAQILVDLGVTTMRLMTNNPTKYGGLEGFGLDIVERVPLQPHPNPENIEYLRTKRERMGHLLEGLDDVL